MIVPEGMDKDQDHCLHPKKAIYRLVQCIREYSKKLFLVLKYIVLEENKSDPCLLSNWNGKEVILIDF
jgi:hypothetical protein